MIVVCWKYLSGFSSLKLNVRDVLDTSSVQAVVMEEIQKDSPSPVSCLPISYTSLLMSLIVTLQFGQIAKPADIEPVQIVVASIKARNDSQLVMLSSFNFHSEQFSSSRFVQPSMFRSVIFVQITSSFFNFSKPNMSNFGGCRSTKDQVFQRSFQRDSGTKPTDFLRCQCS